MQKARTKSYPQQRCRQTPEHRNKMSPRVSASFDLITSVFSLFNFGEISAARIKANAIYMYLKVSCFNSIYYLFVVFVLKCFVKIIAFVQLSYYFCC
jgi:hypothetical protein